MRLEGFGDEGEAFGDEGVEKSHRSVKAVNDGVAQVGNKEDRAEHWVRVTRKDPDYHREQQCHEDGMHHTTVVKELAPEHAAENTKRSPANVMDFGGDSVDVWQKAGHYGHD